MAFRTQQQPPLNAPAEPSVGLVPKRSRLC